MGVRTCASGNRSAGALPPASLTASRLAVRIFFRHSGRMLFFTACVAAGTAFLFGVENLLSSVERALSLRAREILEADVEVVSNRPFDARAERVFKAVAGRGAASAATVRFASMLSPAAGKPFLVSVKAVERPPFYGRLEVEPAQARLESGSCFIEAAAAVQHGIRPGDSVRLGRATLTVAGLLAREPGRAFAAFSLGPRVLVPMKTVRETKLIQFGSRIRYTRMFALPPSNDPAGAAQALRAELERELHDPYINLSAYGDADPTVGEAMRRTTMFFLLVSLVALLLSAVGLAAGFSMFLNEQLETVGILRALGLSSGETARLYHGIGAAVGLLGGLLGAAAGWALSGAALGLLARVGGLQFDVDLSLQPRALAETLAIAVLVSVGVTWARVRALSRLPVIDILGDQALRLPAAPLGTALTAAASLALLSAYSYVKINSLDVARTFSLALAGGGLLIGALIAFALKAIAFAVHSAPAAPFALRHGLLQLTRQKSRTLAFLFTLSAGFGLLGALGMVHRSLDREILLGRAEAVPDLFLVDVQKTQVSGVAGVVARHARGATEFSPLVRARLTHVNSAPVARRDMAGLSLEDKTRERALTREYNLTYQDRLNPSEEITAGRFWESGEPRPQISLEQGFAKRVGLKLGDVLRFDIQGREVEAPVTSLRRVDWMSMRPNFFVIFTPSALERAPQISIASLRIRNPLGIAAFSRELVGAYPNVSVINVTAALDTIQGVLDAMRKALAVVAWFCVGVGLLVLSGTLTLARRERAEHAALLRALGAPTRVLLLTDAVEFIAIGLLTFAIASGASWGLGWVVSWKMDLAFAYDAWGLLPALGAALVLPLAVGLAAAWPAYRSGVMETLRRES